jgi:polyisoprenoid-binding protein YceI
MCVSSLAGCIYTSNPESLKVEWTAFKTPLKIGVSGSFKNLGVSKVAKAENMSGLLSGIGFNIDTNSVDSKNQARDAKLLKFFFQAMSGGNKIKGKTLQLKKKVLKVAITMNGKTNIVPLRITKSENSFKAIGSIDLFDFAMSAPLAGINKACEELHQGKTWNDVNISLSGSYSKVCD